MAPTRVGIIGLSGAAKTAWASTAHLPYLKAHGNEYVITALCNTSTRSAETAIDLYGLPPTTKAYGDPSDLANDDEIDLVVCCTRVDLHYETIRHSVEKGKNVFVEWPLCSNLKQAQELNKLARDKGVKTMVALQGRVSPVILMVKSLLSQNRIGDVLSSSVAAYGGTIDRSSVGAGLKYFMQRSVGGNMVTIGFAHMIDYIHSTLGEFRSTTSRMRIQRPLVPIRDTREHRSQKTGGIEYEEIVETIRSDVPDLIILDGVLNSGASLSVTFRRGQQFKGSPGFQWQIYGEKGEIQITSSGPSLQALDSEIRIRIHDFTTDQVGDIPWQWHHQELPPRARNTAALYEAFHQRQDGQYPTFEDAVSRHRQLEDMFDRFDKDQRLVSQIQQDLTTDSK